MENAFEVNGRLRPNPAAVNVSVDRVRHDSIVWRVADVSVALVACPRRCFPREFISSPTAGRASHDKRCFSRQMTEVDENQRAPTKKDYGSAQAYVDEVRNWMYAAQMWTVAQQARMACFQQRLGGMTTPGPQFNVNINGSGGINIIRPEGSPGNRVTIRLVTRTNGGAPTTTISEQHEIAPFSRRIAAERIAAECIDCVLVFLLKLIVAYLLEVGGYIDFEAYDRILDAEADLQSLIDITQGLFPMEVISKLITSVVEALCISYGFCGALGTTPGKYLCRLRVISCSHVEGIPGNPDAVQVTVVNNRAVPLLSSFLRSLLKNLVMNFFFPISTVLYLFQFNRTFYDLAAKTIVVRM
uniref:RDD domain-containing protein n=1 Tax=Steinernema glaseri TaxID=37863 RepID=A0A1I8AGQ0_9BILA